MAEEEAELNASKRRKIEENIPQILTPPPPGFLPKPPITHSQTDDECLSKRRKVEETVLQILKTSDLETATEIGVREAAAQRLGFDLSDLFYRLLVRQLVDSFLLSTATSILETTSSQRKDDGSNINNVIENNVSSVDLEKHQNLNGGHGVELRNNYYNGKLICKLSKRKMVTIHDFNGTNMLSKRKMVTIHDFNGTNMVSIRDFYKKEGKMHHSRGVNSGITLPPNQWSSFRNSFPSIQEAISKLESRVRFEAVAKQNVETVAKQSEAAANSVAAFSAEISQIEAVSSDFTNTIRSPINKNHTEANTSKCVTAPNSQEHNSHEEIAARIKPTESDICTLAPEFPNPGKLHYTPDVTHAIPLIPIQPSRFDGRNYHSWRLHMEMFLNQLNLSYVLFEPCPSISSNPEASINEKVQVQSATQRWIKDDYMCRDNILKSLCDSLFQSYSQKTCSAKELWEELKLVYNEDFGTNRSQINKYINFQMVDGVSILQQVEELHKIANTIMASGFSWIDENFHVSAIVSKLPPSWKEFRVRLMHEEFLPVHILMHRLQVEEESRKNYKKESNYRKDQIRKKEYKKGCFRCGREGHVMKNCPDQRFEVCGKNNGKENGVLARDAIIVREANMG